MVVWVLTQTFGICHTSVHIPLSLLLMMANKELLSLTDHPSSKWTLSVDGLSNVNGTRLGLILTLPEEDLM